MDGGAKIDGVVVGMTEDTVVTKGVTGGNGLVTRILGWEPEGGNGVLRLGGKGSCYTKGVLLPEASGIIFSGRCSHRDTVSRERY